MFKKQIGSSVGAYVDDMVVRSSSPEQHLSDPAEVYEVLRCNYMCLNPEKCVFGVGSVKFLGFMISARGIDVNPAKVEAIQAMRSPICKKEVQKLHGAVNYLSCVCAKLAERLLPFFSVLKKSENFKWTDEMERAFQDLKEHFVRLHTGVVERA